jgi:hypothetical protein
MELVRSEKTEDRRQKTEDRRQKTEDRRQKNPEPQPSRRLMANLEK